MISWKSPKAARCSRIASLKPESSMRFTPMARTRRSCRSSARSRIVRPSRRTLNPRAWTDAFLDYDYIGAKWAEENVRRDGFPAGHNVGNGGFSLRSDFYLGAGGDPHLEKTHPEDTHLCGTYRPYLEGTCGIKYATAEVADRFSFELDIPESPPFGFHGSFNLCRFEPDPKWMRFEFLGRDFPAT